MSSQESVGESRVSHPASRSKTNSDADHFGPATEEEMEADLRRIGAMAIYICKKNTSKQRQKIFARYGGQNLREII